MSAVKHRPSPALTAPQQAVSNYLSALLSEDGETSPAAKRPSGKRPVLKSAAVTCRQPPYAGSKVQKQRLEASPAAPVWSQGAFQVLLFKVDGVTLAAPLSTLENIIRWDGKANSLPGQPGWQIGVIRQRGKFINLIDSVRLIMPERQQNLSAPSRRGGHVLIIGDGHWGLCCDRLQRPQTLRQADVRWRTAAKDRPWIAGTLVEKLCVLLNIEALIDHLWHK